MGRSIVIGGSGLLGRYLVSDLRLQGQDVLWTFNSNEKESGPGGVKLDIRDQDAVSELLSSFSPDHVYLSAAVTNVDLCERSPSLAWEVNAEGTMAVATACRSVNAKLLYVSTDYVFNGMKGSKYLEFDEPDPLSIYGQTKLEGERLTLEASKNNLVCRVAVLYGLNNGGKTNFVTWMMDELKKGNKIKVFNDQFTSPTYAPHCAGVLIKLMTSGAKGTFHTSGPDCLSRYDMALTVAETMELDTSLIDSVAMDSSALLARRPKASCLSVEKAEVEIDAPMLPFKEGILEMRKLMVH